MLAVPHVRGVPAVLEVQPHFLSVPGADGELGPSWRDGSQTCVDVRFVPERRVPHVVLGSGPVGGYSSMPMPSASVPEHPVSNVDCLVNAPTTSPTLPAGAGQWQVDLSDPLKRGLGD